MSVDMKVKAIYDSEIGNITRTDKSWMDVLKVAGQLYRYEFDNIVMVTAQRPPEKSTLMADYDTWKKGGKHFMDIMNGSYAQTHFPCKLWDAGEKGLTLSAFEWEKERKTLIYGQVDYMYGEALYKLEIAEGNPIRLYSLDEITEIFGKLGLRICNSFADFNGKPSSDNDIQLMVYSIRE